MLIYYELGPKQDRFCGHKNDPELPAFHRFRGK